MVSGCTKRVVVIRDLPSNVIEEAILILKNEPSDREGGTDAKKNPPARKKLDEAHLLKEAELIINNYIKENNLHVEKDRRHGKKQGMLKACLSSNVFINFALMGGILLFIFLLTRVF